MPSLYGDVEIADGVRLSAGVENLANELYREHLSGINRNALSDIPVGERVPGAGRGAFVRMQISN